MVGKVHPTVFLTRRRGFDRATCTVFAYMATWGETRVRLLPYWWWRWSWWSCFRAGFPRPTEGRPPACRSADTMISICCYCYFIKLNTCFVQKTRSEKFSTADRVEKNFARGGDPYTQVPITRTPKIYTVVQVQGGAGVIIYSQLEKCNRSILLLLSILKIVRRNLYVSQLLFCFSKSRIYVTDIRVRLAMRYECLEIHPKHSTRGSSRTQPYFRSELIHIFEIQRGPRVKSK